MPLIDQADVDFVHEGGWLQRMARRLAPQLRACDASEMVVDNRDQLVKRVSSAIADREEQLRDPGRIRGTMAHIPVGVRIGHVLGDLKRTKRGANLLAPIEPEQGCGRIAPIPQKRQPPRDFLPVA
jgi:hypothetical protein